MTLDLSLITKLDEKPKTQKRVTRSVKESGIVGGNNLIVLTALTENGVMTAKDMVCYLDWPYPKCAKCLFDLVRLELAEKVGKTSDGLFIYSVKRKSDEND